MTINQITLSKIARLFTDRPETRVTARGIAAYLGENTIEVEKVLEYLVQNAVLISNGEGEFKVYKYARAIHQNRIATERKQHESQNTGY
ncbi:MAG: hypothetical protein HY811_08260 [Planctomycetes bacterium]|nr:hypothetical protein [Planctomycetota bacterium]